VYRAPAMAGKTIPIYTILGMVAAVNLLNNNFSLQKTAK
jgi:hypothetical protein